jgi:hypothetical protein
VGEPAQLRLAYPDSAAGRRSITNPAYPAQHDALAPIIDLIPYQDDEKGCTAIVCKLEKAWVSIPVRV